MTRARDGSAAAGGAPVGRATAHEAADLAGHRGRLFAVAYRLLGSVADAEDVVQDVAETWTRTDHGPIADPEAWLVTVTTRRCLDRLRSARHQRERYVGPWLPEPLLTSDDARSSSAPSADPADVAALADDVSFALLVVLDRLAPAERVAFVLHDVFGEPYARIAEVVDRSPEATRQLASRARRRVRAEHEPALPVRDDGRRVTEAFLAATREGDLSGLMELLAPDVELVSDGGGKVRAARRPVVGSDRVARFLAGVASKADESAAIEPVTVNGGPGVCVWTHGVVLGVAAFEIVDQRIHRISFVVNPDKLRHLDDAHG